MKKIFFVLIFASIAMSSFAQIFEETAYSYSSQDKIGGMHDAWSQWFDCNIKIQIDQEKMEVRVIGFQSPTLHVKINDITQKGDESHFYCTDIKTGELVLMIYKEGLDPQGKLFKSVYFQHPDVNVVFALKLNK